MIGEYERLRDRGVDVGLPSPGDHVEAATKGLGVVNEEILDWLPSISRDRSEPSAGPRPGFVVGADEWRYLPNGPNLGRVLFLHPHGDWLDTQPGPRRVRPRSPTTRGSHPAVGGRVITRAGRLP